jgi:hypothetical protein
LGMSKKYEAPHCATSTSYWMKSTRHNIFILKFIQQCMCHLNYYKMNLSNLIVDWLLWWGETAVLELQHWACCTIPGWQRYRPWQMRSARANP